MTVYDAASPTPGWFGEGLTYQIFPDRFCRSRLPDMAEMPAGRRLHGNWEDIPDYLPDGDGEYCRDFFGGDLAGIRGKLPNLRELGVEESGIDWMTDNCINVFAGSMRNHTKALTRDEVKQIYLEAF